MSRGLRNLSECFLPDKSGARKRSREIDAMLKRDRQVGTMILLFGSEKSGKATFLKQMRIVKGAEFNHEELLEFREAIYDNIIRGMRVLVQERKKLGIPWQNSANEMHEMLIESFEWRKNFEPSAFQPYVSAIDSLWKDSGIQEAHRSRTDFELYESVKYYFDNIHRIGQLNYLPHNQDILYTHKYRSIKKHYFVLRDSPFLVAEWGLREPLSRIFRIKHPILYIIGSSDYDRICNEYNCLVQSLYIFTSLYNKNMFLNDIIILFFNKMDLLAEKVQTADIRKHFPEFQGDPHRLEDVQEFLIQSFKERTGNYSRPVFYHMITAVDIDNFRDVFKTVEDTIMRRNLNGFPIL
ncbi:guanine nucleotide-binding protein subunit alpha-12 [Ctenopharyngodon idella]|uniref:guanine nucleotide-binding protein subunit alpha-12 n=1 Tax=Ctenopharyngodon idella TaxID=7959 RepID=UPI00222E76E5|nr:guanine nucleotide-binding protein subunit alpha-12 [Ctenopharyngodon idella]XP_051747976.1 guanine nucleotide-binding protein subunit alpha-12 [Ctenopharyngodon idella]